VVDFSSSFDAKIDAYAKNMTSGNVEIGFLGGHVSNKGINYATIAFWNEFGVAASGALCRFLVGDHYMTIPHAGIPSRPFFRSMISKEKGTWASKLGVLLKSNKNTTQSLSSMGADIKGALQASIQSWTEPANAPITIAKKGFDNPLVDTGNMGNTAIEVKVNKGLQDD